MTLSDKETFAAQDTVLVGLTTLPIRLGESERRCLYALSPWRAVMLARLATLVGAMPRAERDGLVAEARSVGGEGALKPWGDRTERERYFGVRAGVTTGRGGD